MIRKDLRFIVPVTLGLAAAASGACRGSSFTDMSHGPSRGHGGSHGTVHADSTPEDPSKAPQAFFAEPEYDFGDVAQGEKVSHTFHLRNKGPGVLRIKNVHGS